MANVIDNAVARLQTLALACTSVSIKSAPSYPIENADPAPFVISYIKRGQNMGGDATFLTLMPVVEVVFFFNRSSLKSAYQQADAIALEYNQRLCGDPTLNAIIDTLNFPIDFTVGPMEWNKVPFTTLTFTIKFKTLESVI
jgi:hypothetical protein